MSRDSGNARCRHRLCCAVLRVHGRTLRSLSTNLYMELCTYREGRTGPACAAKHTSVNGGADLSPHSLCWATSCSDASGPSSFTGSWAISNSISHISILLGLGLTVRYSARWGGGLPAVNILQ